MTRAGKNRALPRRERSFPQSARVFSTNFPKAFTENEEKCYIPWSDYMKLEKKYLKMFKRYNYFKNNLKTEKVAHAKFIMTHLELINKYHDKNEVYYKVKQALKPLAMDIPIWDGVVAGEDCMLVRHSDLRHAFKTLQEVSEEQTP